MGDFDTETASVLKSDGMNMKAIEKPEEFPPAIAEILEMVPPGKTVKINLAYTSYTGGHRSAAEAIQEYLDPIPGIHPEVVNIRDNIEKETGKRMRLAIHSVVLKKLTMLRSWFFRGYFNGSEFVYRMSNFFIKIGFLANRTFLNRIQRDKVDMILSCDSALNAILSWWRSRGLLSIPVHSLITDFRAHRLWVQDQIDMYYVACSRTREDLIEFGVDPERIVVTGLPVKKKFFQTAQLSRDSLRRRLGVNPDTFLVVIVGGSLGLGPYEGVARTLQSCPIPVQAVFCTGRNRIKKMRMKTVASASGIPLKILDYVDNMQEWIEASDLMITKPGGLSVTEILVKNRPMLHIRTAGGLEEAQADYLDRFHSKFRTIELNELNELVEDLANGRSRWRPEKETEMPLYRQEAPSDICRQLVRSALDWKREVP
jgi:processive 1,2-diacylglycerol beta-glucosyltransferase